MKVDIRYHELLRLRFLVEALPYELRRAIDSQKYDLFQLAKTARAAPGPMPVLEKFISADDHIYEVKFTLGRVPRDASNAEPIEQLLILRIERVPGMHGI